jgi:hypothetical protein
MSLVHPAAKTVKSQFNGAGLYPESLSPVLSVR